MRTRAKVPVLALALAACGSQPIIPPVPLIDVDVEAGCEGLDPGACLLPWPSSQFLVDDASRTTGRRVEIPAASMPADYAGRGIDPEPWNRWDGFSATTTMLARLQGQVVTDELVDWQRTDESILSSSPTILLDTTGPGAPVRVAHFAEVQEGVDVDPAHTTLYIRPRERLEEGHHYVVAIRGLAHADGTPVASSPTFAALRDGRLTDSEAFEARRDRFEADVLGPVEEDGIDEGLILAWDFWTASGDSATRDLVAMRDQALEMIDSLGCGVEPDAVDDPPLDPLLMRRVEGWFDVPYFLDDAGDAALDARYDEAVARLVRDAEGLPQRMGTRRARFVALLPMSIDGMATGSVPVIEYGHGLFNDAREIDVGFVSPILSETGSIGVATSAYGLASNDLVAVADALTDLSRFSSVSDRVLQGVIAMLVLPQVFATRCAALPELQVGGETVADPTRLHWMGNSQGAIFGPTIAALSPDISRFALGVGGISYSIMMPRSCQWPTMLELLLSYAYQSRIDRDLLMVMFAHHFDRFEGAAFAPHVLGDRLPDSGEPVRVLYQTAVNDPSTPEVSGEIAARTLGLDYLASSATRPSGLTEALTMPTSAFVSYDLGGAPVPLGPLPAVCPDEGNVHELLRRDPDAQAQIAGFLMTGQISP